LTFIIAERKGDIPLLIEHFIRKYSHLNGKEIQGMRPEVLPILMSHDFPGNIRELENIIEYATVVCKDQAIGIEHLPEYLHQKPDSEKNPSTQNNIQKAGTWESMEKEYLLDALTKNNWNRRTTAKQLGIHSSTLWRKIKQLNLTTPKKDGRTKVM
jgi:transcriptional regulator with PAS, ATPase and Fis domain